MLIDVENNNNDQVYNIVDRGTSKVHLRFSYKL